MRVTISDRRTLTSSTPAAPPDRYFRTDHLREGVARRTIRGGAVTLASQAAQFALTMGATVILARLLTPRDYGLIGMVTVVTGFLAMFKDIGLSQATVQRAELSHGQTSNLFWINVVVSAAIMLVTIALAPAIARFYGEPRLTLITIALSGGFLLGGLNVQHQALLRRQMRFGALAVAGVLSIAAGITTAIILAWRGASYWALVGQQLAAAAASTIAAWVLCGWRPSLPSRRTHVRDMLAFGGNVTGFNVVNYFARNGDNLLIGRVWGAGALGLYDKAYQLLLFPLSQINYPVAAVAVPALSRLAGEPDRYRAAFLRTLEKIVMLTLPLVMYLFMTSDWVVLVVLGPKWTEASRIFMWLAIAGFTQPVGNTTGWLFISQDRTRAMFHWGLIGSGTAIASIVVGLPWGAEGVAMAYALVGVLVRTPLNLWFVGRAGPVRTMDFYRAIAPFALAALCEGAAIFAYRRWAPPSSALIGLVVSFGIATVAAIAGMYATRGGRQAIRDVLQSLAHLNPTRAVAP
ncbi:MAG TPA: lipopolysaccharide biosynthesis protein [Gemmatimonadaceae bacterium]